MLVLPGATPLDALSNSNVIDAPNPSSMVNVSPSVSDPAATAWINPTAAARVDWVHVALQLPHVSVLLSSHASEQVVTPSPQDATHGTLVDVLVVDVAELDVVEVEEIEVLLVDVVDMELVEVVEVKTQTDGVPVHSKPASTSHAEEQPSPSAMFASSHASPASSSPSPQNSADTSTALHRGSAPPVLHTSLAPVSPAIVL
jgi:hypothetical protein